MHTTNRQPRRATREQPSDRSPLHVRDSTRHLRGRSDDFSPRRRALRTSLAAIQMVLLLIVGVVWLAGCQPRREPQRTVFDEAEAAYRLGHYDDALEKYEAFLKTAPEHQLAPLAQERILSIERELEVVMGRKNGPRPIYLRPVVDPHAEADDQNEDETESPAALLSR